MRLALMADVHANREAFEACLADAEAQRVDRLVLLGDYVNYGADPEWVVTTIMDRVARHRHRRPGQPRRGRQRQGHGMDGDAESALAWTRNQLGRTARSSPRSAHDRGG